MIKITLWLDVRILQISNLQIPPISQNFQICYLDFTDSQEIEFSGSLRSSDLFRPLGIVRISMTSINARNIDDLDDRDLKDLEDLNLGDLEDPGSR